jgi:energy-coupling factor transporter transmembrane protein EcfT
MKNKEEEIGGFLLGLMFITSLVLAIVKVEWYLDFSWWWVFVPVMIPGIALIIAVIWVEAEIVLSDMAKKQVEKEEKLKKQK